VRSVAGFPHSTDYALARATPDEGVRGYTSMLHSYAFTIFLLLASQTATHLLKYE